MIINWFNISIKPINIGVFYMKYTLLNNSGTYLYSFSRLYTIYLPRTNETTLPSDDTCPSNRRYPELTADDNSYILPLGR